MSQAKAKIASFVVSKSAEWMPPRGPIFKK
jgi:hypothetical protein